MTLPGIPARPRSLQFLLWDGTDPSDSHKLGAGLNVLRWENLLHDSPPSEFWPPHPKKPRVFQPAGADFVGRSQRLLQGDGRTVSAKIDRVVVPARNELHALVGLALVGFERKRELRETGDGRSRAGSRLRGRRRPGEQANSQMND